MDNNQNGQENKAKKSKKIPILCTIGGVAAAACIACAVLLPKWQDGSVPASVTGENTSVSETAEVQSDGTAVSAEETDVPAETLPRETPEDCIVSSVSADKTVGRLISTDSAFTLTTREDMDEDSLKAHLALTPDGDFDLTKTGDKSYRLTAAEQFAKGAVVKLALNNDNGGEVYSWAFQTEDDFRLKSYYPDNGSDYVSCDTGIEFEFTAVPDAKKAEEYFSVSPEVKGRFMTVRNTLVFIPNGGFKNGSVYNVTLKEGLPSVDGIAATEGCTFSFRTSDSGRNSYCYASNGDSESFLPDDVKVIEISCSQNMTKNDFSVDLYRYSGAEDYYKALCECADSIGGAYYIRDNYTFDTSRLEKVYSSTDKLLLDESKNYNYGGYIMLPDDLQEGWYLADIKTTYQNTEYHIQRHIQVNTMAVYASFLSGEALYFVNDTITGAAAENADISLYGGGEFTYAKTDSDGVAKADIKGSGKGVMRVTHNGRTFIDFFDYRNDEDIPANEKYYMYLYTDRQMYLSTDTINVWGMIRPRSDKYTVPDDLYISRGSDEVSDRVYIKPDEKGFFTAKIQLNKNVEGYGNITLCSGDEEMYSKWLRIYDYVKPTYFFDPQLPAYAESPQTNPVPVSFDATFTEGTPAEGVEFTAYSYYTKTERTPVYTTDENGHAEFELLFKDKNSWQPSYESVEFELDGIENEYQSMYVDILMFYRDVMVETNCEKQDKKGILDITTSMINAKAADEHSEPYYFAWGQNSDELRGAPYDTEVSVTLVRNWSEKKESGSYYDFLEKRNITKYTYDYREEVVGTYTVNTVGGKATMELPLEYDDSSYHINIRYKDSQGRSVSDTEYIYSGRYYSDGYKKHYYTFDMEDTSFTEGQTVNISLNDNYEPVENNDGRIFYIFNQEDYVSCGTSDKAVISHTMTAEYIPCVRVSGAYFDGKHVYTIYNYDGYSLKFDPEEREYTVSVGSDKDSYKPGEKATITVRAVDKDGEPAANADVSLSVVDEAAFTLADQTADPLGNIYTSVWYPSCDTYCSYVEHSLATNGMGEKGGGEGDGSSVRRDFKDNAAFMTGKTNSDGTAVFTFTLPDNLTEWRCTAQAVGIDGDGRIYAGTSREPLIVTVPFFITTISLPTYTEGDDISVSAISHGDGGTASITARITGGGIDKTVTAQSGGALNFGKLPIGEYKVLFTAESGGQSDAVELPLSVVGTQLETEITNFYDLSAEKLDISPTRYPVHISFFDKEYLLYSHIVYQLSNSCSSRLDFNIAQGFAFKELGWYTEEEYIKKYGGNSGAMKVLPAAQTDLELTALVCGAAPELVEKAPTVRTFYNALKGRDVTVSTSAVCYYGLASLGEPVLTEIYDLLESEKNISAENGLYLAAALAKLGDSAGAQEYYTKYSDKIIITDSETGKEAYAANTALTKTALLAASAMHHPEAEYIARYLYSHPSNVESCALQLMTYLKHYVPKNEGGAEICYDLNGAEKTVKLDKFRGNCVSFGEEQLKNANIRVKSGEVVCIAMYTGRVSEIKTEPTIGIRKSVSPVNGVWAPGELVRVTIDLSDTKCKYNIVGDVIPSGARFTSYQSDYFHVERSGQRIKISAYDRKSLTYYYRLAALGEFVSEAPTVRDFRGNWGIGESSTITVSEQTNETA